MKLFAFIMAVLVLALSFMPCADTGAAVKDSKAKSEITKTADQPDHQEDDSCSPFCHCACCAGFSINHTLTIVTKVPTYSQSHETSFLPKDVIEIVLPIWQPPRIV